MTYFVHCQIFTLLLFSVMLSVMLNYAMLSYTMICYVTLFSALLCYLMLCDVIICVTMLPKGICQTAHRKLDIENLQLQQTAKECRIYPQEARYGRLC